MVDFTRRLPRTLQIDEPVRDVQRHASETGIQFLSFDARERAPANHLLGRVELSVMLRGRYAGLKTVLAQISDRYPNLVLQSLTMKRLQSGDELDAHVSWLLLAAPDQH